MEQRLGLRFPMLTGVSWGFCTVQNCVQNGGLFEALR